MTVKERVKVKVKGHIKSVTRKVKKSEPASLILPNEFVAQNGAVLKEDTTIGVSGCPKAKAKKASKATSKRHRGHSR